MNFCWQRSLEGLASHGCRSISLTVTNDNLNAIRLYESLGFHVTGETSGPSMWELG